MVTASKENKGEGGMAVAEHLNTKGAPGAKMNFNQSENKNGVGRG